VRVFLSNTVCRLFGHWGVVILAPLAIRNRLYRCRLCGLVYWDSDKPIPREEAAG